MRKGKKKINTDLTQLDMYDQMFPKEPASATSPLKEIASTL